MKYIFALICSAPLLAQTTLPGGSIPISPVRQQNLTSGMIGFTTGQTARLNVFNLNPVPSTTSGSSTTAAPASCTIEIQFLDNKGTEISQYVVPNFDPGTATLLDLPRANVTTQSAARAEIRGVVMINPAPTPVDSPAPLGNCSVFATLEIFDATGSTVALTSDFRLMPGLYAVIPPAALK
jgi:FtsP/CotA-like multicopper oxidase with cupredoxin domain